MLPVHSFLKIRYKAIHIYTPKTPKRIVIPGNSNKIVHALLMSLLRATITALHIAYVLITLVILCEVCQLLITSLHRFLQAPVTLFPIPEYPPKHTAVKPAGCGTVYMWYTGTPCHNTERHIQRSTSFSAVRATATFTVYIVP